MAEYSIPSCPGCGAIPNLPSNGCLYSYDSPSGHLKCMSCLRAYPINEWLADGDGVLELRAKKIYRNEVPGGQWWELTDAQREEYRKIVLTS